MANSILGKIIPSVTMMTTLFDAIFFHLSRTEVLLMVHNTIILLDSVDVNPEVFEIIFFFFFKVKSAVSGHWPKRKGYQA